jgi:hypothetical protein
VDDRIRRVLVAAHVAVDIVNALQVEQGVGGTAEGRSGD